MDTKPISQYLKELKNALKNHKVFFLKRAEDGIMDLGLTNEIAIKIISELSQENYVKGPEKDYIGNNYFIWEFGVLDVVEIYIKMSDRKDNQRPVCLSFHKAKKPQSYPLKGKNQKLKQLRI